MLASAFDSVEVDYAVRSSMFAEWGLYSWTLRRPIRTVMSMFGNVVNGMQSASAKVKTSPLGTCHLVAVAKKSATGNAAVNANRAENLAKSHS